MIDGDSAVAWHVYVAADRLNVVCARWSLGCRRGYSRAMRVQLGDGHDTKLCGWN